jgi:hypothetical protein
MPVTFKDLKKRVSLEVTQQQSRLFERLQNKPFWIWNIENHKQETSKQTEIAALITLLACHKDGNDKPIYDYEKIIFDALVTPNGNANKHLWIKKATGYQSR